VVDGRPFIHAAHIGKNGETLQIPLMSEAWEKIRGHAKASGPILEGSKTERGDDVFDRIGVVMRSLGWETEKTIHEMRKFVASRLLEKYAPSLVANYTRHRSVRTLERYYARYLGTKVMDVALR
jgi:integrase